MGRVTCVWKVFADIFILVEAVVSRKTMIVLGSGKAALATLTVSLGILLMPNSLSIPYYCKELRQQNHSFYQRW
jgi:hypothetical protein